MKPSSKAELLDVLKEDYKRYKGDKSKPAFQAIAVHRFGTWAAQESGWRRRIGLLVYNALFVFVRNFYGIEIPLTASVGRRVLLGHQHGIVFHRNAVVGDDCVIRHNVTIGAGATAKEDQGAVLGTGVVIGPGTVIIGGVHIGDGARIGPNSLVTQNVPAGAFVWERSTRIHRLERPAAADQD